MIKKRLASKSKTCTKPVVAGLQSNIDAAVRECWNGISRGVGTVSKGCWNGSRECWNGIEGALERYQRLFDKCFCCDGVGVVLTRTNPFSIE